MCIINILLNINNNSKILYFLSLFYLPAEKIQLIEREASRRINESLQRPWVPPHCSSLLRKYKATSNEELCIPLIQYGTSHLQLFETDWNLNDKLNYQSDLGKL